MTAVCTIPELRHGLQVAHELAKAHVGFVVMPVTDRADFVALSIKAAERLNALADAQEGGAS